MGGALEWGLGVSRNCAGKKKGLDITRRTNETMNEGPFLH